MNNCIAEQVFNGTDDTICWVLMDGDSPVEDLSIVTRATVLLGSQLVDSDVSPDAIWWTDQKDIVHNGQQLTVDVLKLKLGAEGLSVGKYNGSKLTIYDPFTPNGIPWSDTIAFTVQQW